MLIHEELGITETRFKELTDEMDVIIDSSTSHASVLMKLYRSNTMNSLEKILIATLYGFGLAMSKESE
jgi:thioester reductase-like protein